MGVHVGCVITYPDEFQVLNKNKFVLPRLGQPCRRIYDCRSCPLAA